MPKKEGRKASGAWMECMVGQQSVGRCGRVKRQCANADAPETAAAGTRHRPISLCIGTPGTSPDAEGESGRSTSKMAHR